MEKKYILDLEIYDVNFINNAISDFSDYSQILLKNNELIISWKNEDEIEKTFNEFMNYVIWLINE